LFRRYPSLIDALKAVYPETSWEKEFMASTFVPAVTGTRQPTNFWKEKSNLLKALDEAELKIGIKQVMNIAKNC